jgi:hypothetical protein
MCYTANNSRGMGMAGKRSKITVSRDVPVRDFRHEAFYFFTKNTVNHDPTLKLL